MDKFVTTYRHDYLWPYMRAFGKPLIESKQALAYSERCVCPCFHGKFKAPTEDTTHGPGPGYDDQNWNQISPMGKLLDPKLYPPKVGRAPENESMRVDQPNKFVNALREKYPFLYEVLKTSQTADLLMRVNKDRYRTTYQVDYCQMGEESPEEMFRAAGVNGIPPCPQPNRLPGDQYQAGEKPRAFRNALVTKGNLGTLVKTGGGKCPSGGGGGGAAGAGGGGGGGGDGGIGIWTFNKSEYMDGISRLGGLIIRDKLHYHTK